MFFIVNSFMLILSLSLGLSVVFLQHSTFFSWSFIKKIIENNIIELLLLLVLYVYRYLCKLPKSIFFSYVAANFSIIVLFYCMRFYVISNSFNALSNTLIIFYVILFILSAIFLLSRIFFRTGYMLDQNENIVHTLLDNAVKSSVGFLGFVGRRISGQMPPSSGNGFDRNFALGVGTFAATAVAAGTGFSMARDSLLMRRYNAFNGERAQLNWEFDHNLIDRPTYNIKVEELKKKYKQ